MTGTPSVIDLRLRGPHDVSPIRSRYQPRKAIAPLALVLGSALAFLVMFELLLRSSVPYLPLRYHKYLPGEMFMLAQHSKRALIPMTTW
jgi:hypothetical protein